MEKIRRAVPADAESLTELACLSEAVWGFDLSYMRRFRVLYEVTEAYLETQEVFLLESGGKPLAFYGLKRQVHHEAVLEYFYVSPDHMGKHYGRRLWRHLIDFCEGHGLKRIHFVTSPEAAGFYIKMGAEVVGETVSHVAAGRKIPELVYDIHTELGRCVTWR